jgi:osmotically-inducible protein OsmY
MFKKIIPLVATLSLAWMLAAPPATAGENAKKSKPIVPEVSEALQGLAVRAKLVEKLGVDALRISVSVKGEKATLTGDVPKKATQETAKEVALSVAGIKDVDNQVKELAPAGTMANAEAEVKDAGLEIKIKTLLLNEIGSNALSITVESTDGVVSLRGKLDSDAIAKAAVAKVKEIKGVKKVVNLLKV